MRRSRARRSHWLQPGPRAAPVIGGAREPAAPPSPPRPPPHTHTPCGDRPLSPPPSGAEAGQPASSLLSPSAPYRAARGFWSGLGQRHSSLPWRGGGWGEIPEEFRGPRARGGGRTGAWGQPAVLPHIPPDRPHTRGKWGPAWAFSAFGRRLEGKEGSEEEGQGCLGTEPVWDPGAVQTVGNKTGPAHSAIQVAAGL